MDIEKQFKEAVETYLLQSGIRPTVLGMQAVNDPSFVTRLRGGRNFKVQTIDRVYEWMKEHPPA
ncbi:MAG: hypothetical protein OEQ39_04450 [Gammaproteobacteria bacterium]|nr:hypothetical protein [Gammaproteobacteria bacterium]